MRSFFIILLFLALTVVLFGVGLISQRAAAVTIDTSTTTLELIQVCGDGKKDEDEVCDPGSLPLIAADLNGQTCQDYGYVSGILACAADCSAFNITGCYTCGNSIREAVEECDSGDYGGRTCLNYGYNSGTLSCTATCIVNLLNCYSVGLEGGSLPSSGGGGGGGSHGGGGLAGFEPGTDTALPDTKVMIKGKAYPNASVNVLKESELRGIAKADEKADFTFEDKGITPGIASYSFWSEDKNKIRSNIYTLTFQISQNALTTVTGAYLAPTITSDKVTLKKGEYITIFGQTIPQTGVFMHVHSSEELIENDTSDEDGEWRITLDTTRLADLEEHTAKAYFESKEDNNIIRSEFSKVIQFYLGEKIPDGSCAGADLNSDKKVNLTDFSILLYHWGTKNACADQNHDGTVNLVDFSIMMFNWTG